MYSPDQIPFDETPRGHGDDDAIRIISDVLDAHGVDAPASLYDQALRLARDGHLGRARDLLRMLLCLGPDDGDAHLLLAKVLATQKQWQNALSELDAAAACGAALPPGMKEAVERFRAEARASRTPEHTRARIDSEIVALREEARRIRSENARLRKLAAAWARRARLWTLATTAVSLVASALILFSALAGRAENPRETTPLATESPAPARIEAPVPPSPQVVEAPVPAPVVPAAAPAPSPAAEPAPESTTYTVRKGDNLSVIARRLYGRSSRWPEILEANRDLLHGSEALQVGMELRVPAR